MDKRTQGPRCAVVLHAPYAEQGFKRCRERDNLLPATVQLGDGSVVEILICQMHVDTGLPVTARLTTEGSARPTDEAVRTQVL